MVMRTSVTLLLSHHDMGLLEEVDAGRETAAVKLVKVSLRLLLLSQYSGPGHQSAGVAGLVDQRCDGQVADLLHHQVDRQLPPLSSISPGAS